MDNNQHPCVECLFYIKPGLLRRWLDRGAGFAERCDHPAHRDRINGLPMPCKLVRVRECSGREGQYSPDDFRSRNTVSASEGS